MRYLPPKGTAGLARSRVSGCRRVPSPPAITMPRIFVFMTGSFLGTMPSALRRVAMRFSARAGCCVNRAWYCISYRWSEQCMLRFVHEENAKPGTRSVMHRSENRILTTHVGSLPRPPALRDLLIRSERGESVDTTEFQRQVEAAVQRVVVQQLAAGIDIGNNGEQQRVGFKTYLASIIQGYSGDCVVSMFLEF